MKKVFSVFLVVLVIAFLVITNPTTAEYARWYTAESFPEQDSVVDDLLAQFTEYMAGSAVRTDYLVCSVFNYNGHKTLGIALMFVPLDDAIGQAEDIREAYGTWLEDMKGQN